MLRKIKNKIESMLKPEKNNKTEKFLTKLKNNKTEEFLTKLLKKKVPEELTGKNEVWLIKYRERYGEKDCSQRILSERLKLFKTYLLLGIGIIILIFATMVNGFLQKQNLSVVTRPDFGEFPKKVTFMVRGTLENTDVTVPLKFSIHPKTLRSKEKEQAIENYASKLPEIILGENESLYHITNPLNLQKRDPYTGILVEWKSENEDVISHEGNVNFLGLQAAERVVLQAEVTLEDMTKAFYFPVVVVPDKDSKNVAASLKAKIYDLKPILEQTSFEDSLILPKTIDGNVQLEWSVKKDVIAQIVILLMVLVAFQIYRTRFRSIDKEIENGRLSIMEDFPGMVDKLVLLLNAGLVLSGAMDKMTQDYRSRRAVGKREIILYEELCEVEKRVKGSNASLLEEIQKFSKRSGVRELMRFSAILSENIHKGAGLSAKLESEAEMLWLSRKKRAEEKGRLAETKLALPLMLLLLVFIMITITPALMEI